MPNSARLAQAHQCLIVSLDAFTLDVMRDAASILKPYASGFSVGLAYLNSRGLCDLLPRINQPQRVFVDARLSGSQKAVCRAVEDASALGAGAMTVQILGMDKATLQKAVDIAGRSGAKGMHLFGALPSAFVLYEDYARQGLVHDYSASPPDVRSRQESLMVPVLIGRLARLAKDAGLAGLFIEQPWNLVIRNICGPDFLIVQDTTNAHITPAIAADGGADRIIVAPSAHANGMPDLEAFQRVFHEIAEAFS